VVYTRYGQGKPTLSVVGCSKSATEASINFYGGLIAELKPGFSHPGGSTRSGEATGGSSAYPTSNHIYFSSEPSSVGSSMSERRGSTNEKAIANVEEGSKTLENVCRLRDLWE